MSNERLSGRAAWYQERASRGVAEPIGSRSARLLVGASPDPSRPVHIEVKGGSGFWGPFLGIAGGIAIGYGIGSHVTERKHGDVLKKSKRRI